MKLLIKDSHIRNEYEVNEVKDLIEGIKDYCQYFLPEIEFSIGE